MIRLLRGELLPSLRLTVVYAVLTGLIYPLLITGVAEVVFPSQANGSLVTDKRGQVVGSSLIGQQFAADKYFHGRVSYTVDPSSGKAKPYAAENSAGSNLGPNSKALSKRVTKDAADYRTANGLSAEAPVPVDAVTQDFTGFDPDISEANGLDQVNRVAAARNLDPAKVRALVESHVQGRVLFIFGEPHVNVLQLNLALDSGAAG